MKRVLMVLTLLCFSLYSIGQARSDSTFTKDYYLQKSKQQKATGRLFAGIGTGLLFTSLLLASTDNRENPNDLFPQHFDRNFTLFAGGVVMALVSTPFFISSTGNAKKAASIGYTNQPVLWPQRQDLVVKALPSITVRVTL